MKNIKKRYILISILIAVGLAALLLYSITVTDGALNKICIVGLVFVFIYITFAVQLIALNSFGKDKLSNYKAKEYSGNYNELAEKLKNAGFKERKRRYGLSFIKIVDDTAYKCDLVNDSDAYFEGDSDESNKSEENIDKCNYFIGLEIFKKLEEDKHIKLCDFSIAGGRIYYNAMLNIDGEYLKCFNYAEPKEVYKDKVNFFYNLLGLIEIEKREGK